MTKIKPKHIYIIESRWTGKGNCATTVVRQRMKWLLEFQRPHLEEACGGKRSDRWRFDRGDLAEKVGGDQRLSCR